MKTLTITNGRSRLGYWLKRALEGDDVGFMIDGAVVALRPVLVHSDDFALQEYGLTEKEAAKAVRRIDKSIARERKAGTVKRFTGGADALRN